MAHESFENEKVAAIMNREFVNIKVDREERPDVDRVYMTFVQATTGGGGMDHRADCHLPQLRRPRPARGDVVADRPTRPAPG